MKIIVEAFWGNEVDSWNDIYCFEYENLEKFKNDFETAVLQAMLLKEEADKKYEAWQAKEPDHNRLKFQKHNDLYRDWLISQPNWFNGKFMFDKKEFDLDGHYEIYSLDEWFDGKLLERP